MMKSKFGYWLFVVRLWRHERANKLRWKIAWMLPRSIALLAFVRVYSASSDCAEEAYDRCYKGWEAGNGQ